jgi:ketosteroid isomerase-like protein
LFFIDRLIMFIERRERIITQSKDIGADIAAANITFMQAFKSGDAAGLAALYTEDGQVLPPNSDFITG